MANRKLSLPLFSAKTRVSQPGCSTSYLHFVAISDNQEISMPSCARANPS